MTNALRRHRLDAARPGQAGFFRDGDRVGAAQPVRQHERPSGRRPATPARPCRSSSTAPGESAGTPVTFAEMMVGGYTVRWDWDAAAGLFLRSQLGSTHELTDGQASTNNVVVLVVAVRNEPARRPRVADRRHRRCRRLQQRAQGRGHLDARDAGGPVDAGGRRPADPARPRAHLGRARRQRQQPRRRLTLDLGVLGPTACDLVVDGLGSRDRRHPERRVVGEPPA